MVTVAVSVAQRNIDMTSLSRPFDYGKLYEFADPLETGPYRLRSRLPVEALQERKKLHLLARGETAITEPIQFDAAQGDEATDVLWTQLVGPVCVSGRVVRLLEENKISGWSTYPVEVYDQQGNPLPDYHGFAVTGVVCKADYGRSAVVSKPPPTLRGKGYDVYRGLYFDESQWDGSDMFWVDGVLVVVDKVYRLFKTHKVVNVRLITLLEREIRVRYVRPD